MLAFLRGRGFLFRNDTYATIVISDLDLQYGKKMILKIEDLQFDSAVNGANPQDSTSKNCEPSAVQQR